MKPLPKWSIVFTRQAEKEFSKLNRREQNDIYAYLSQRLLERDDPRDLGKPLKGRLSEYWRYRVGDYRVICKIEDQEVVILVVRIAHRKDAYLEH